MMTRRDWWIGIGIIVVALVLHAALPRYDWRQTGAQFIRIDRWTGRAERGVFDARGWVSLATRSLRESENAAAVLLKARQEEERKTNPARSVWDEVDDLLGRSNRSVSPLPAKSVPQDWDFSGIKREKRQAPAIGEDVSDLFATPNAPRTSSQAPQPPTTTK